MKKISGKEIAANSAFEQWVLRIFKSWDAYDASRKNARWVPSGRQEYIGGKLRTLWVGEPE